VSLYPSVHLSICMSVYLSENFAYSCTAQRVNANTSFIIALDIFLPTLCQCKYSLNDLLYLQP
jgi:hypothetical protein